MTTWSARQRRSGPGIVAGYFFPFHLAITARLRFFSRKHCGVLGVSSLSLSSDWRASEVCMPGCLLLRYCTIWEDQIDGTLEIWRLLFVLLQLLSLSAFGRCQLTPHKLVVFQCSVRFVFLSCGLATVKHKPWSLMNLSVFLSYPSHWQIRWWKAVLEQTGCLCAGRLLLLCLSILGVDVREGNGSIDKRGARSCEKFVLHVRKEGTTQYFHCSAHCS